MTEKKKQEIATAYLRARASRAKNATPESVLKIEAQRAKELDPAPKGDTPLEKYFAELPDAPYIAFKQKGEKFLSCVVMVNKEGRAVEVSIFQ